MVKIEFFTMNLNEIAKQEQQQCENKLSSLPLSSSTLLLCSPIKKQMNFTTDYDEENMNEFTQYSSETSLNYINTNANSFNNNNSNKITCGSSCSCSSSNSNIAISHSSNCSSNSSNSYVGDTHSVTTETSDEKFLFARRLGYEEHLIYTALSRLGTEAKENELLAELIKLSELPRLVSNTSPPAMKGNRLNDLASLKSYTASLRHIVIDGSNVALSHGNNKVFSCRGIKIAVEYFRQRGHKEITAFVPTWRKESGRGNLNIIKDQEVLYELERDRVLVFTPSRLVDGKRVACYDDRYILKLAAETEGVVVSNDNYRDLALENNEFHKVIKERILMYTFVNDLFMPPDDPLGRNGPSLDMFLKANQQMCPYGKKCTYGNKCKYRHQNFLNHPQLKRIGCSEITHLPITSSISAPLNKKNNSSKEVLNRAMSSTVEQQNLQNLCHPQSQLTNQQYNTNQIGSKNSPPWYQFQNSNQDDMNTHFQFNLKLNLNSCSNPDENVNKHKKLQRQIASRVIHNQPLPPSMTTNGSSNDNHNNHRSLAPTISAPPQFMSSHTPPSLSSTAQHQNLTRIPSAPVSNSANIQMPLLQNLNILSASDSQLNDSYIHRSSQLSIQEQRRLLRFHLSSIFPQNQVDTILKIYPNVCDAKTICTALINLFPN